MTLLALLGLTCAPELDDAERLLLPAIQRAERCRQQRARPSCLSEGPELEMERERATEAITRVLRENPENAHALWLRGHLSSVSGDFAGAERDFFACAQRPRDRAVTGTEADIRGRCGKMAKLLVAADMPHLHVDGDTILLDGVELAPWPYPVEERKGSFLPTVYDGLLEKAVDLKALRPSDESRFHGELYLELHPQLSMSELHPLLYTANQALFDHYLLGTANRLGSDGPFATQPFPSPMAAEAKYAVRSLAPALRMALRSTDRGFAVQGWLSFYPLFDLQKPEPDTRSPELRALEEALLADDTTRRRLEEHGGRPEVPDRFWDDDAFWEPVYPAFEAAPSEETDVACLADCRTPFAQRQDLVAECRAACAAGPGSWGPFLVAAEEGCHLAAAAEISDLANGLPWELQRLGLPADPDLAVQLRHSDAPVALLAELARALEPTTERPIHILLGGSPPSDEPGCPAALRSQADWERAAARWWGGHGLAMQARREAESGSLLRALEGVGRQPSPRPR